MPQSQLKCDDEFPWDYLLNFIEAGVIVPIVGPDLLTIEVEGRKVLLYPFLAEKLAEKLEQKRVGPTPSPFRAGRTGEPSLNAVAYRYLAARRPIGEVHSDLCTILKEHALPVPPALCKLAAIDDFQLFVSTTFDPFLKRAIDETRRLSSANEARVVAFDPTVGPEARDPAGSFDLLRPCVFHLFGMVQPLQRYAVTEEDLVEFIVALQDDRRPNVLFNALRKKSLLILGSGFSEWLARLFLRIAISDRLLTAAGRHDFVADLSFRADEKLVVFLEYYSRETRLFHGDVLEFVDELHVQWSDRRRRKGPVPTSISEQVVSPGVVFISHAAENSEAARKLKAALQDSQISVWLDEDALGPGQRIEWAINHAIASSSLFVALVGKDAIGRENNRFLFYEWNTAEERAKWFGEGSVYILPISLDDTDHDAPGLPERWQRLRWETLSDPSNPPRQLVDAIKEHSRRNQLRR
jgi:hypothetical protein